MSTRDDWPDETNARLLEGRGMNPRYALRPGEDVEALKASGDLFLSAKVTLRSGTVVALHAVGVVDWTAQGPLTFEGAFTRKTIMGSEIAAVEEWWEVSADVLNRRLGLHD